MGCNGIGVSFEDIIILNFFFYFYWLGYVDLSWANLSPKQFTETFGFGLVLKLIEKRNSLIIEKFTIVHLFVLFFIF